MSRHDDVELLQDFVSDCYILAKGEMPTMPVIRKIIMYLPKDVIRDILYFKGNDLNIRLKVRGIILELDI